MLKLEDDTDFTILKKKKCTESKVRTTKIKIYFIIFFKTRTLRKICVQNIAHLKL